MTEAPAFDAWLDSFFEAYYRTNPVNATFIGMHAYDDRLPDFSDAGRGEALATATSLLRDLRSLPAEHCSDAQQLDRQVAEGFLEITFWESQSAHFHYSNPSVFTGEAIFGVLSLFLRDFGSVEERVDCAVARMEAVPRFLAQARGVLRQAPAPWVERARRECTGALAFLRRGIFLLGDEYRAHEARLHRAADRAALAFVDFQHYLETDLAGRPSDDYACGPEIFDLLLRRAHFLTWDAAQIESYAQAQMVESTARLVDGAREFGVDTWPEALGLLAEYHPRSSTEYYARYPEVWDASRRLAERHKLLTWPDFPLRFVPQPHWVREAAPYLYFLFYRSPAPYDSRDRPVDYLVAPIEPDMPRDEQESRLRATNDSVIKLNHVVHHGGVGHHVQNWHAFRAESRIGRIAAVDGASRIAMLSGGTMAEGWACYATGLMGDAGFLTPLERYSEHHSRLRMAARAIVDIGIHQGTMSIPQAAALYRDRVGMSEAAASSEAIKNSMFPGGAVMYLAGTDLIKNLRDTMAMRAGSDFDLTAFHDRLLSYGSLPVNLIRQHMSEESPNDQ